MTREELIADLETVLQMLPQPAIEISQLGVCLIRGPEVLQALRANQVIGISPRYLRAILAALKGEL